jgi:dephospho-CoA kinase
LLKIGLTGGIGSGKTTAGDYFAEFGAEVIDTDLLSRELVEPGRPALAEIVAAFGAEVLDGAGRLDRARLRERIFSDAGARRRLEQILHPRIRTAMLARAERTTAPYVIFVIPLLFETGQQDLVDRVLLIDVPEAMQRRRVAARDALDDAQIEQIMQAQTDRPTRLRNADDVIHNDGSRDRLRAAVQSLHQQYLQQRPL